MPTSPRLRSARHPAQQRLAFEELLAHHLSLQRLRAQLRSARRDRRCTATARCGAQFCAALRVRADRRAAARRRRNRRATSASRCRCCAWCRATSARGKTVVAALAALRAIEAGYQVALMAPTELLAEQHFINFRAGSTPLGVRVAWLAGKLKGKRARGGAGERGRARRRSSIGTHALMQEGVAFHDLALVDHRRAAPLRRAPAPGAARQGPQRRASCRTSWC